MIEQNAYYAECRGRRWLSLFSERDWVAVAATTEQLRAGDLPDAIESGGDGPGQWVKLPKSVITAQFRVLVRVVWRGESFTVARVESGRALLYYEGYDEARARELGMEGSNYNGWSVTVSVSELELVEIDERQFV